MSKIGSEIASYAKEHLTELSNSKRLIKLYEVSNHPKQAYKKL